MVKLEISNTTCGIRPCDVCIKVKYTSCYLEELWSWIVLEMRLLKTVFKIRFKKNITAGRVNMVQFCSWSQIYLSSCLILATCGKPVVSGILLVPGNSSLVSVMPSQPTVSLTDRNLFLLPTHVQELLSGF